MGSTTDRHARDMLSEGEVRIELLPDGNIMTRWYVGDKVRYYLSRSLTMALEILHWDYIGGKRG